MRTCTVDEDLLYFEEILSPEERFDFCYELVWRYEKGFIPYTGRMRDEIHKIWDNAQDQEWLHEERKVHWFNMGYALLRDYREDLDAEKWSHVYNRLWEQRDLTRNGEAELQIEKIHLLFMQTQLEETRSSLLAFQCDTSAFGITAAACRPDGRIRDAEGSMVRIRTVGAGSAERNCSGYEPE